VRVIDELMGHSTTRRPAGGAAIGRVYRETTPEMVARVVAALERRLGIALKVAYEIREALVSKTSRFC
jgi:hypothetical protein